MEQCGRVGILIVKAKREAKVIDLCILFVFVASLTIEPGGHHGPQLPPVARGAARETPQQEVQDAFGQFPPGTLNPGPPWSPSSRWMPPPRIDKEPVEREASEVTEKTGGLRVAYAEP
jgi:hypothetical protein